MKEIGEACAVLAVMNETPPILERLAVLSTVTEGGLTLWRTRLGVRDVWLAGCGIGKVNAAMATQALLGRCRPTMLCICGSAGSLATQVQAGDLLIADRMAQHDIGVNLGRRFVPMGMPRRDGRMERILEADPQLVRLAEQAGAAWPGDGHGRPPRVHRGVLATGDQILFSEERRDWIRAQWGALAVDMESAAAAQVAAAAGVPWLALRGISDTANEECGMDMSRLVAYTDESSLLGWARLQGRRLGYLAKHPDVPRRLRALHSAIQLAADRAASLTVETLRRL